MTNTNTVAHTIITGISLAKLVPSPAANARRTGTGLGIEALAVSIQAHELLQSLVVRPKLDGEGQATGKYEVAAGGRRVAALKLLAKRKCIGKGAPIPCRVLDADGVDGAEASLAENVVRRTCTPPTSSRRSPGCTVTGSGWASRRSLPGSECPPTLSASGCAWPLSRLRWCKLTGTGR